MILKLARGGRRASLLQALLAFGLIAVSGAVLAFCANAKRTADRSVLRAEQANTELTRLRTLLESRCNARTASDRRFIDKARKDAETWSTFYSIAQEAPIPTGTDPRVVALIARQRAAMKAARDANLLIVSKGVIASCDVYKQPAQQVVDK